MNRKITPNLIIDQRDIDMARDLAGRLANRLRMVECSLHELDHGVGAADQLRHILLDYAVELTEATTDLVAQLQVFSEHREMEVGDESPLSEPPEFFFDLATQMANFAVIHGMNGIAAEGPGICLFAQGETAKRLRGLAHGDAELSWHYCREERVS